MVRCRVTFYKWLSARFCRFFFTPEPQLSCRRNSLSASWIVREFSCGRWRGEQQSSTGDPGPRHEFGRVPPPHERRALHVRAAPGHRFNDMNTRVIVAARLPAHAPHGAEPCWHSPRLPRFGSARSAPQRRDARIASAKEQARGFVSRWCAVFHAPQFARRGTLATVAVHSRIVPGLPPRPETAYDLPQFWVRLMPRGVSNGARGVALSDLTFSRRVL